MTILALLGILPTALLASEVEIQAQLKQFISGQLDSTKAASLFVELGKLPEDKVTQILLSEFPIGDLKKPEKMMGVLELIRMIQEHGSPNFTTYIIRNLTALENGSHILKPMFLYGFMKAGSVNKERIEKFLAAYKSKQTDQDTLHSIGVLEESLTALWQIEEQGDPTAIDVEKRVKDLNKMISTVWYQCPSKVWKPSIPVRPQALFKDDKTGKAWLINEDGLKEVESLPAHLDYDYKFEMSYLGERPIIALGLQRTLRNDPYYKGSYGLYLAFHEGFHQFFQTSNWKVSGNTQRGDHYPGRPLPRYYRRMVYEHLKKAVLENNSMEHIKKAAFWYKKWKTEFSDEIIQVVDRHEGVAMYYDVMAVARAHQGCDADSNSVLAFIQNNYDMFFEAPTNTDKEGYNLGGLAGVLLWQQNLGAWQSAVVNGKSPLDLLFANVKALAQDGDEAIHKQIQAGVVKNNTKTEELLHGDLENFESGNYVRVTIPYSYENKRMTVFDLIIPRKYPKSTVVIVANGFNSETPDGKYVKALGALPLFSGMETPCSEHSDSFLIEASKLTQVASGKFKGKSPYVDFKVEGEIKTVDGLKWLCSQ